MVDDLEITRHSIQKPFLRGIYPRFERSEETGRMDTNLSSTIPIINNIIIAVSVFKKIGWNDRTRTCNPFVMASKTTCLTICIHSKEILTRHSFSLTIKKE